MNKEKSQGSPQRRPCKLSNSHGCGWWIWAENSQSAWTLPSFFQVQTFFQWQAFSFSECSSQKRAARCTNRRTPLLMLIQDNWKGTEKKKKWRKWWRLYFGPEALLFISSFIENLLSSADLLSWQLNRFPLFLWSSHIHVGQNEASVRLTCLNHVVLAVRCRISICVRQKKKRRNKKKNHWHEPWEQNIKPGFYRCNYRSADWLLGAPLWQNGANRGVLDFFFYPLCHEVKSHIYSAPYFNNSGVFYNI